MADDLSGFSMLELFRLEAESQTAILSAGILAVEETQRSPETIEAMMRAAHSLKGAARIVGLEPAVQVAHVLEDCFVLAGKGEFVVGPEHVDVLLAGVDFLSSIAKADDALDADAAWGDRAKSLVRDLAALPTQGGSSSGPPAADEASPAVVEPTEAASPPPPQPPPVSKPEPTPSSPPGTESTAAPADAPRESTDARSGADAKPATRPIDQTDRVVRVSAESLTRLVALAGESLVEARQLRPFVDSMVHLRGRQTELCDQLSALEERLRTGEVILPAADVELLARVRSASEDHLARFTDRVEEFEAFARRNEDLSNRLHHEVIKSRMRPLADGIRGFPRMVRDLARQLGTVSYTHLRAHET